MAEEEKKDFQLQEWLEKQDVNKYIKIAFIKSLDKEIKTENTAKKQLEKFIKEL